MTEREWQTCADPRTMLEYLRAKRGAVRRESGRRKFRLFASACLRDVWPLLSSDSRKGVEVAERYCDGSATAADLAEGADRAQRALNRASGSARWQAAEAANHVCRTRYDTGGHPSVVHVVSAAIAWTSDQHDKNEKLDYPKELAAKYAGYADWVRDLFGNPFRPVKFSSKWRTGTAVTLARQMYESREFSAMPILADALQDAGCDNEEVLNHCRDVNQVHVRGCWVLDSVLGIA